MLYCHYVSMHKGDRCKVKQEGHPFDGKIVVYQELDYMMQLPLYVFRTETGERVVLQSEFEFAVLPYKESLRGLLDLALDTGDLAWADELARRMTYETQD